MSNKTFIDNVLYCIISLFITSHYLVKKYIKHNKAETETWLTVFLFFVVYAITEGLSLLVMNILR